MLYLYQSNRLEYLAALLAKIQSEQPLQQPFAAEEIIVQSQGMRRYLSQYLAKENGIAANLSFSLPAGLMWQLVRRCMPNAPKLNPFAPEVMRWRLLALFSDSLFANADDFSASRAALLPYLSGSPLAAYQLAGQLADIFDQYLVYRESWIDTWSSGKTVGNLGSDEIWQAELWHYLNRNPSAPHRIDMRRHLSATLNRDMLPERYFVFGIAALAPMYLNLLTELSQHCDIHILALNPAEAYWGDLTKRNVQGQESHPLLASLGRQGRDFFDDINAANPQLQLSPYDTPASDSLLHCLQYDIQCARKPSLGIAADDSIVVQSAHSALRELHILKDYLLQTLADHPDWQPHDIAVLTPKITQYTPYIEGVFGQNAENSPPLPYSVADVALNRRQPLFAAWEILLEIFQSRFEADTVLSLIGNEIVRSRFEFSEDDAALLRHTVRALNIHWGWDGSMRDNQDALFTWQQGLDRLTLGSLMNGSDALWQGISPYPADLAHLPLYGRFNQLLRCLKTAYDTWQTAAAAHTWVERVRDLSEQLFGTPAETADAQRQFDDALENWLSETALAGFTQEITPEIFRQHLHRFLNGTTENGFLRGGITFCNMVPMRSLPFKVICLIGLNDSDFPRTTRAVSFDLIARNPQKGDRSRRDDDRYLFLEALMSAREKLYLSYVGRDNQKDSELAPSPLVNELVDTLAEMTGTEHRHFIHQHPLQAFSQRYFDGSGPKSSRQDYARAYREPHTEPALFFTAAQPTAEAISHIEHHDLVRFWRNPVRYWLRRYANWLAPYPDRDVEAAEPFNVSKDDKPDIAERYLNALRRHEPAESADAVLLAQSRFPSGELGQIFRQRLRENLQTLYTEWQNAEPLPPQAYTLTFDNGITLSGSINHCYRNGRIVFYPNPPTADKNVVFCLEHLIFNSVLPENTDGTSRMLVLEPPGSNTFACLPPIPQQTARQLLSEWIRLYLIGRQQPLPFYPKLGFDAKEAKAAPAEKITATAEKIYQKDLSEDGTHTYTEIALVFGGQAALTEQPLFGDIVENLLAPTLQACLTAA